MPKTQRTQGIEYFDSINTFRSEQKPQQALNSWPIFSLFLFGKGKKCVTTLTHQCDNFGEINLSIFFYYKFWQILTTKRNPCLQLWQIQQFNSTLLKILVTFQQHYWQSEWQDKTMIGLGSDKNGRVYKKHSCKWSLSKK